MMEFKDYLKSNDISRYDNFDFLSFLSKIKFTFTIPFIHITGTNGKGSVSTYLYNAYSTKYDVGLFTSPHFKEYKEDIINNVNPIKDEDMETIFQKYKKYILKYNLTSFELITFMMLFYFQNLNLDLCIIEVGMGGCFDATNINEYPLISIINNVSLEHANILGRSISEIAYNKCGIIKKNTKVLINEVDDEAKTSIVEYCLKNKASIHYVSEFYKYELVDEGINVEYYPFKEVHCPNKAIYQRSNIACALECISLLNELYPLEEDNIQKGFLKKIEGPRFKIIKKNNKTIIVDGAHNPHAIEKLIKSLNYGGYKNIDMIFGVFKDKNIEKMLGLSAAHVDNIYLTTFDHKRARDEEGFFLFSADYKFVNDYKSLFLDLQNNETTSTIVITGSYYFASLFLSEMELD